MCRRWLQQSGRMSWSRLTAACTNPVLQCLNNISKPFLLSNPQKYIHCCDFASTGNCKEVCKKNLKKRASDVEIMNNLKSACGPILLHGGEIKMTQCLLHTEAEAYTKRENNEPGERSTKEIAMLHCCNKASSNQCRKLCYKTFHHSFDSWPDFNNQCLINSTEDNLSQCMDEAVEPCELGCDGLSFCTDFNNRPAEMFRSCEKQPDQDAEHTINNLINYNYIQLPNRKILYIKNITQCEPKHFKTIACLIQIRPCHRMSQTTRICYENCTNLLAECADFEKMKDTSVEEICNSLSIKTANTNCISIEAFDNLNPPLTYSETLTRPCKSSPCSENQICRINRSCSSSRDDCDIYTCTPGCFLGQSHGLLAPVKSYVRVPNPDKKCSSICQCTPQGSIKHCKEDCNIHEGSNCDDNVHGSSYLIGCNLCSCYHGETICSKKQCNATSLGIPPVPFTSLPCNCLPHYVPVCGNGVTYPNNCLARCADIADIKTGECSSINPCEGRDACQPSEVCLPKRIACFTEIHKCPQYTCVNTKISCNNMPEELVCDTEGHTHENSCYLIQKKKTLAYFGRCLANCRTDGMVCGVDGNNYMSECAAHARYISVDYDGPCVTIGTVSVEPKVQCAQVNCPPLAASQCMAFTPPGACCPICAGAFTVLISKKEVERGMLMSPHGLEQFSVETVMAHLEREVSVTECALRGHLTIEIELLVMVVPTKTNPTPLELEACVREAEKITILIQRQSPRLKTITSTSILTAARIVHQPSKDSGTLLLPTILLYLIALVFNL
ncbi:reversion-inducing cysteine-rich protein with Kazal motifs [Halyomorpha halys]|uniref:reversion-inducing cysteine-rich protein with Kazal motifs n=1 Tax=Halyomorpha halys TaxID=286706 RepID=UPI0034D1CA51